MTRTLARGAGLVLASALAFVAGCQRPNAYAYQQAGDQALSTSNYARAVANYEQALAASPGNPEIRHGLARAYIGQGRYLEAAEHAKVAFAQRTQDPAYADTVAEALLGAQRHDEMFRFLRQNTSEYNRVSDWVRLGTFARRAGDYDTAQTALVTAARVDRGQTPEPQLALCDLYSALGQSDKAMERLRMAYFTSPMNSQVRTRLAQAGITPVGNWGVPPPERSQ